MKYQKIVKDNYNLHIINTDKFKTINVRINFKRKIKKEEITIRNLLNDLLINTSKKYPTSRDIEIETEDLYNVGVGSTPYKSGNYHIISFRESFLDEKYTEKGMNEKSIEFLLELIFNPNVKDKKFDKEYFDLIKKTVEDDISSIKDNPGKYSLIKLFESMDDGPLSYRSCGYLNDLKKINEENIYEYYKSVLKEDVIDIFIIGNINEKKLDIFDKYIKNNNKIEYKESHFIELNPINDELEVKESITNNQSKLAMGFTTDNLTDFELKYVLAIYSLILGGGPNSKLFQNVREKNSLCYYINTSIAVLSKIMTLTAGINSKDYKKTIELINIELDKMKKGEFTTKDIEDARKIYINGCNEIYDAPMAIINNYLSSEYGGLDLVEKRLREIKKVTKKDIVSVANKVNINKIFLLEGTLNNEKEKTK